MCIAILNTKSRLPKETLKNSWNNNDQGGGLLWNENNQLQTFKTYKFKEFLKKYNTIRNNPQVGKIVLHFRIATSGHEKFTNLHPFKVNQNLSFVHNGILAGLGNNQHSDTYQFNEMLKQLPSNFLESEFMQKLLSKYICTSKLIFLDNLDNHTIINENLGSWIGDTWYSNDSHTCDLSYYYYGNQKVSKDSYKSYDSDKWWNNYDGITDYKKESIDIAQRENTEYLQTWQDADDKSIKDILYILNKDIKSPDLYANLEDLANYYETYNLKSLIRKIQAEAATYMN
tara:strand:- start:54 stop:911 length:858 start_codon:yes stop_codon:yes gene_type:complete